MAKFKGDIVVDTARCKGCRICLSACPTDTITMSKEVNAKGFQYAITQNDACIGCANCAIVCPDGVITVYKKKIS